MLVLTRIRSWIPLYEITSPKSKWSRRWSFLILFLDATYSAFLLAIIAGFELSDVRGWAAYVDLVTGKQISPESLFGTQTWAGYVHQHLWSSKRDNEWIIQVFPLPPWIGCLPGLAEYKVYGVAVVRHYLQTGWPTASTDTSVFACSYSGQDYLQRILMLSFETFLLLDSHTCQKWYHLKIVASYLKLHLLAGISGALFLYDLLWGFRTGFVASNKSDLRTKTIMAQGMIAWCYIKSFIFWVDLASSTAFIAQVGALGRDLQGFAIWHRSYGLFFHAFFKVESKASWAG